MNPHSPSFLEGPGVQPFAGSSMSGPHSVTCERGGVWQRPEEAGELDQRPSVSPVVSRCTRASGP